MTEHLDQTTSPNPAELRIRQAMPARPGLSDDFDAAVLGAIRHVQKASPRNRRLVVAMAIYWGAMIVVSAILMSGSLAGSLTGKGVSTLLWVMVPMGLTLGFMARQARIRLTDLFLRSFGQV